MMSAAWEIPDYESGDPSAPGRPLPALVSLHFLRSALRRRWLACVLSAVLGLLAAVAFLVAFPHPHEATATVMLAHDSGVASTDAISTDLSLLSTRTVASRAVASLGVPMTANDFIDSVTAVPVSTDVLSITLTAPTESEAVRRLDAFIEIFLNFRAEQLVLQSNVVVDGMTERIEQLQAEVADLTQRIDEMSEAGDSQTSALSDAISLRAKATGQIDALQQSVQDANLNSASVVNASRVIDHAAAEPGGMRRRIALALASGLIAGAAIGCGVVLFLAITSDRLRRRYEVATALQTPVPISVGRIAPIPRLWRWLPRLRAAEARRSDDRQRLARAFEKELPGRGRWGHLAVACIENADEVRFAIAAAATHVVGSGRRIVLIDLTEQGGLHAAVEELMSNETVDRPIVLRPRGIPALASGPADLRTVGNEDEGNASPAPDLSDVSMVLVDLDPAVGADHLTAWTQRLIVTVTSGKSSAERVRTAGDMVRAAGLDLRYAALLHADVADASSGGSAPAEPSRPMSTGR
jgi:capsular polysaccharide biosynthesis protein